MGRYKLVLLDRPAWFLPAIEQEQLVGIDGEVQVGWARLGESRDVDPVNASLGLPQETFHLWGKREFALMKPTAYVINTARGPVIHQAALIGALQGGRIAGAGLDVFEREPLEPNSPLLTMDNVILTPHTAGMSDSSQIAVRRRTARNIAAALTGEWPSTRDLVNPQVKEHPRQAPSSA